MTSLCPREVLSAVVADVMCGEPKMFHRVYSATHNLMMNKDSFAFSQAVSNGVKLGSARCGIDRQTSLLRSQDLVKPFALAMKVGASKAQQLVEDIIEHTVA